jgi:integrase
VTEYAVLLGFANVAPHDLRRTFAKLAHKGDSGLDQIQLSLGHGSIQTTERYLGVEQDYASAWRSLDDLYSRYLLEEKVSAEKVYDARLKGEQLIAFTDRG